MHEKNITDQKITVVYADGGARGNPGPAAWAFVAKQGDSVIHSQSGYLGNTTNNVAEYHGVIGALAWIAQHKETLVFPLTIYLDSLLVVQQLMGKYKVKQSHLKTLWLQARILQDTIGKLIMFQQIPRARNYDADMLVNQTLDSILH